MKTLENVELNLYLPNDMNYTAFQLKLPLDIEKKIDKNDPVYTFLEVMERTDLTKYLRKTSYKGRTGYNATMMLKIVLFAFMNGVYSLRDIDERCKNDIRFMYIAQEQTPSFKTIGEFISNRLVGNIKDIFLDINKFIIENDEVDTNTIFIDGTKIEANATKFSFVWKKVAEKTLGKTWERINNLVKNNVDILDEYNLPHISITTIEHAMFYCKRLSIIKSANNMEYQYGKGKRKTKFQRFHNELLMYSEKLAECLEKIEICGPNRNSYSKTDNDATMMHMKEDYYMKTGIFKPGYNFQIGTSSEYVLEYMVSQDRADQYTFMPFLEKYKKDYGFFPKTPVADAGYGSYDNYMFCVSNNIELTQKYSTYSIEKTTKYKKNKYRKDKFIKNTNGNYICPQGNTMEYVGDTYNSKGKYLKIIQNYRCNKCDECPFKKECTKSKDGRSIGINVVQDELYLEAKRLLDSERGIELRIQRSIQTEGCFGVIKSNWDYDRIHRRGIKKVETEFCLVLIGFNLMKYHRRKSRKILN